MSISIRNAERKDCVRLLELITELAVYEKAPDAVTVTLEHFEATGFNEPVWWAFVAEEEAEIIGFALYYVRYSTWKGARMYLEDIVVTESSRGKGVGKLLFNGQKAEGKRQNLRARSREDRERKGNEKYNATFDGEWVNCSIPVN